MKISFSSRNFDIVMVMDAILISLAGLLIILAYREIVGAPVRHAQQMAAIVAGISDDLTSPEEFGTLRLDPDGVGAIRRRLDAARVQIGKADQGSSVNIFSDHPVFASLSASRDEFRASALTSIKAGAPQVEGETALQGSTVVRLAVPLLAPSSCGSCVATGLPDYAKGDIVGIREISVPVGDYFARTVSKLLYACGMLAASLMVFLGLIIPAMKRNRLEKVQMRDLANTLELQASTDPLTGLYNRRHFERALDDVVKAFNAKRAPLGLLVFDLDHFKRVNDTYGHDAGDMVLREVALRLRAITREGDVVARIGGEEFAVVAPHASPDQMLLIAERYRSMIGALKVDVGRTMLQPTISIGVANKGVEPVHAADLFKVADRMLYKAKREGRNRVVAA